MSYQRRSLHALRHICIALCEFTSVLKRLVGFSNELRYPRSLASGNPSPLTTAVLFCFVPFVIPFEQSLYNICSLYFIYNIRNVARAGQSLSSIFSFFLPALVLVFPIERLSTAVRFLSFVANGSKLLQERSAEKKHPRHANTHTHTC